MKSVKDFDVKNKRVLLRCDFNVPLDPSGNILDDTKIREALPTIQYLLNNGAKVIIITHLGDGHQSVDGVKARLFDLLGGEVEILENIRSHKEETENNEDFAKKLAGLGDIYINEAFDVCHRAHASVVSIPKFLPHGAGFLLEKEVAVLSNILKNPKRPLVILMGGAKAETKVHFLEGLAKIADAILIGGLMKKELVKNHANILKNVSMKIVAPEGDLEVLDIDEKTLAIFKKIISNARTIFWNGPFGKVEDPQHQTGTREIAKTIIASGAFSVVGGGQTVAFLRQEGILDKFNHVSTAGGAMLNYLAGEELPGIIALDKESY